jgi:curved DNA-binding protein CbpA
MDLYLILGLSNNATSDDIKIAYKKLAQQYHPDKNNGDDTLFVKIKFAYEVLIDPISRKQYDTTGEAKINFNNKAKILEFLASMLLQIIDDDRTNTDNFDILRVMRNNILNNINSINNDISKIKKRIIKREKVISKIILVRGNENFLANVLISDNLKQQQILANLETSLDDLNIMLDMLSNYKYNITELLTTAVTITEQQVA